VSVFEIFQHGFHERGGALGSVDVSLVQAIRGDTGYTDIRGHGHFYGDLWRYLYEGLPTEAVEFGVDIDEIVDAESTSPGLAINGELRRFDLIIGADGGKSTIRPYVTSSQPTYAGYTVWRGLVPTKGIAGPPRGSAETGGFYYETLGFPVKGPAGQLWNCGVYMAMPESEVAKPTRNRQVQNAMRRVPEWFVPFVRKMFNEPSARFWSECLQKGKVSAHPVWELASDRVVKGRVALLGDAAHMASPRTGAGAYTAMTDAWVLGQAMSQASSLDGALEVYNNDTVERGERLYASSRRAASYFAPEHLAPISPALLLSRLR